MTRLNACCKQSGPAWRVEQPSGRQSRQLDCHELVNTDESKWKSILKFYTK
jgi:hypothetical protein